MKILYYHRSLATGAEGIHIREIVNALRELGHTVKIVSLVAAQPDASDQTFPAKPSFKYRFAKHIRSLLPEFVYELAEILVNLPAKRLLSREIEAFKPDFIYERYSNVGFAGVYVAKKYGIPLILEANVAYYPYKKTWEHLHFPRLSEKLENNIVRDADHVIVVSSTLKNYFSPIVTTPEKLTVMVNGVNLQRFYPRDNGDALKSKHRIDADVVIGFVGAVRSWHKMDNLFRVLHAIDLKKYNAKMLVVGKCDDTEDLQRQIDDLGEHGNIVLVGQVPHEEVPDYIEMMDITVSPFAVSFSSPMKILEYMAMQKCVVAPDMENIRDIIEHGVNGLLFDETSDRDIKRCLISALEDMELRRAVARNARETVTRQRTWRRNAEGIIEIYRKLT